MIVVDAPPLCLHCRAKRPSRPRGLCWHCYYTPGVKDLYPSTSKYANRGVGHGYGGHALPAEPTAHPPRSPEKVAVLADRVLAGVALWHPDDAAVPAEHLVVPNHQIGPTDALYADLVLDLLGAKPVSDRDDLPETVTTAGGETADELRLCDCGGCGVDLVGEGTAAAVPPRCWGKDRNGRRRRAVAGRRHDPTTGSLRPYCPACHAGRSR